VPDPDRGGGARKAFAGLAGLAFAPDGTTLAALTVEGFVGLFDVRTGKDLRWTRQPSTSVDFTPDGRELVGLWRIRGVHVADAETGQETRLLRDLGPSPLVLPARPQDLPSDERGGPLGLRLSPDGRTLLASGFDGSVHLADLKTGRPLRRLVEPGGADIGPAPEQGGQPHVFAYAWVVGAFTPDGRMAAVRGKGGSVRLFETATGGERARLRGHDCWVTALTFAPDGRLLAAAAADTTVLVWDAYAPPPGSRPRGELPAEGLRGLWADLASGDAARSFGAMRVLAAAPGQAVPPLREHVRPVAAPTAQELDRLVADLDSKEFEKRAEAEARLTALGELARARLRQARQADPPLDAARRIDVILDRLDGGPLPPDQLRELRGVETLERIGTPEARQALEALAAGGRGARLTEAARGAVERLARRENAGR
jgi:hypothetical protein